MKWIMFLPLLLTCHLAAASPAISSQLVFGSCTVQTYVAASGRDEDVSQRARPFRCESAYIYFLDRQYKHVRIRFPVTPDKGNVSSLEFTGVREADHRTIDLTTFAVDGPPALSVTRSKCKFTVEGRLLKSISCAADYSGGAKYRAVVVFEASPGQGLDDDDDDQP